MHFLKIRGSGFKNLRGDRFLLIFFSFREIDNQKFAFPTPNFKKKTISQKLISIFVFCKNFGPPITITTIVKTNMTIEYHKIIKINCFPNMF